jgi:hypothetical protein
MMFVVVRAAWREAKFIKFFPESEGSDQRLVFSRPIKTLRSIPSNSPYEYALEGHSCREAFFMGPF